MGFSEKIGLDPNWDKRKSSSILNTRNPAIQFSFEGIDFNPLYFARKIQCWMSPFDSCLMWITEYGVFSSFEDRNLIEKLRYAYGEERSLGEAPGIYFKADEVDDFCTFTYIGLQFLWDFIMLPISSNGGQHAMFISHDGWARFESSGDMGELMHDLDDLAFKPTKGVR